MKSRKIQGREVTHGVIVYQVKEEIISSYLLHRFVKHLGARQWYSLALLPWTARCPGQVLVNALTRQKKNHKMLFGLYFQQLKNNFKE